MSNVTLLQSILFCLNNLSHSFNCRDNFIHVDIFYPELTYSKVSQQPAFEGLSLVSEIGGFLGLLLGASVITVCELLDYALLSLLKQCYKRKSVTPQFLADTN